MVKLYHGTRASAVEGIRAKGLVPPPGTGPGWYMLTDDLEQAKAYAFDGTVIEFDIPEGKIFGPDRDSDFFLWSATPHSAYIGRDANAYAIKTSVPPQYIERVITGSQRTAMPSWRGLHDGPVWAEHLAVILVDRGGSGRQTYELYVQGEIIGRAQRLDEGKQRIEARLGPLNWRRLPQPEQKADHYFFGPTVEFTDPGAIYVGEPV
jgi:hypothetical protein